MFLCTCLEGLKVHFCLPKGKVTLWCDLLGTISECACQLFYVKGHLYFCSPKGFPVCACCCAVHPHWFYYFLLLWGHVLHLTKPCRVSFDICESAEVHIQIGFSYNISFLPPSHQIKQTILNWNESRRAWLKANDGKLFFCYRDLCCRSLVSPNNWKHVCVCEHAHVYVATKANVVQVKEAAAGCPNE